MAKIMHQILMAKNKQLNTPKRIEKHIQMSSARVNKEKKRRKQNNERKN